jgi:endoribonuclease Dicer
MRIKPELWSVDNIPTELYLTVFTLTDPSCLARPSQPLGLLTRSRLPDFPDIPLFFGHGKQSPVKSQSLLKRIDVDRSRLEKINNFTLRIFDEVFSKTYEPDLARMPYFLAPIRSSTLVGRDDLPLNLIEWEILEDVQNQAELLWDEGTKEKFFENRYITDPFDGSRKLWCNKVTHKYKPSDPVPPNTAPRNRTKKHIENIKEYSCSLWSKSRAFRTIGENQPVVEAELIPLRRNLLDDGNFIESDTPTECFLVLERLKISVVC